MSCLRLYPTNACVCRICGPPSLSKLLGQLNTCNTALPSRCRLQFSQGSQPSSSQFLNSAMNKCCLESQSSRPTPLQEEPDVLPSQLPSQMASQDFVPGCAHSAAIPIVLLPCLPVKWPDACPQVQAHMTELRSCHPGAVSATCRMHGTYLQMQVSCSLAIVPRIDACPVYQC